MLQNIFNKNKSSEIQFLEIDPFWTLNSFYQILTLYVTPEIFEENENWGDQKLQI